MKIKCDTGFGAYSCYVNEECGFTFIQIKEQFVREFNSLFELETEFKSGLWSDENVQEELNNIKDFAFSMLSDLIKNKSYKEEKLTRSEFNKRFV